MVTNLKINHHPPKPEQTRLRLCKDNSYTPLRPPPLFPFIPFPCLIPPHSYLIPPSITPSNHQKTYPTKPQKQNDCTLRKACSRQRFKNTNVPLLLSINLFFYRNNAISETRIREGRSGCTALKSTKGYASICICR